jgi:hypothetical protein
MKSIQLKSALVGLALSFTPALYAHADCRHRTLLQATDDGAAIGASGNAEARQQISPIYYGGNRERFKVQVEADVADGTVFNAFGDGHFAGSLTTALGVAELELDTEAFTLPDELRPVCDLNLVEVTDENGNLVLFGNLQ